MSKLVTRPESEVAATAEWLQSFTEWGLATLQLRLESEGEGVFRFETSPKERDALNGAGHVRFTFDPQVAQASRQSPSQVEWMSVSSPMFPWLIRRLQEQDCPLQALPANDVSSVQKLTERLFEPYQVEGGSVRLGGCSLEPLPLLRITIREATGGELLHLFYFPDGQPVSAELQETLHLDHLLPRKERRRLPATTYETWRHTALERISDEYPEAEVLLETLVYCTFAAGKLIFEFGDHAAELPFDDWAAPLASGESLPPPFHCPHSGLSSYRLATTHDGQVTVHEALGVCEETGKSCFDDALESCVETGKRATSDVLAGCPVTGDRVLKRLLVECSQCRQGVRPGTLKGGRCAACRLAKSVTKDDPRVARVLGEYPKLESWRNWYLGESSSVYVLTATAVFRRLLLVLDAQTLEPKRLATGSRFGFGWQDAGEPERTELL